MDIQTAAKFSGGNARLAISLAKTVEWGGSLAQLKDEDLFKRLFVQRHELNERLFKLAQVLSLVYSFDGDNVKCDGGELAILAKLAGSAVDALYEAVADLMGRDLAQRRGVWRAILPHAIANRLAIDALKRIHVDRICEEMIEKAPERLFRSFTHRLTYLDSSPAARNIVRTLLKNGGRLSDVWRLDGPGRMAFRNIVPTDPNAALDAIEAGLPAHDFDHRITNASYLPPMIWAIAGDAKLFERCLKLLQTLFVFGDSQVSKEASKAHDELFQIVFSGSHASLAQRIAAVRKLLFSDQEPLRTLGSSALKAMLKTRDFKTHYDFQFGARSRDYGYQPTTDKEQSEWFVEALTLSGEIAVSNHPASETVKSALVGNFRGLWRLSSIRDELARVVKNIASREFFVQAWMEAKKVRHYDEIDTSAEGYLRLSALIELLRPRILVDRVQSCAQFYADAPYEIDGEEIARDAGPATVREIKSRQAIALGEEVAGDLTALRTLLPEVASGKGRYFYVGTGLARAERNPKQLWSTIERDEVDPGFGTTG